MNYRIQPPPALYHGAVAAGTAKAKAAWGKIFKLGIVSGTHIAFGAYLAITVGGACPGLAQTNPGLQKVRLLVMFCFVLFVGLFCVCTPVDLDFLTDKFYIHIYVTIVVTVYCATKYPTKRPLNIAKTTRNSTFCAIIDLDRSWCIRSPVRSYHDTRDWWRIVHGQHCPRHGCLQGRKSQWKGADEELGRIVCWKLCRFSPLSLARLQEWNLGKQPGCCRDRNREEFVGMGRSLRPRYPL